jgi:hypothetical protein
MRIFRVLLAFSLVVIGVVSTVGSGGGGGGSNNHLDFNGCCGAGPTADVDITVANAQDVSATVVRAINQVFDVATKIGGQIFPSPPAAPDFLSSNSKFELFSGVANGDMTDPCAVNGTVTVTGFPDNNPVSLSVGDVFYIMFDVCDDGDAASFNGSFYLHVRELNGDPRTDVFRLVYALQDMTLTVASGIDSYVVSNNVVLGWDSLAFPEVVLAASTALSQLSSQGVAYSWLYGDHSLTVNADISNPMTLGEAHNSLMESTILGDYISYEIIVPLQAPEGQVPESGEILISGGEGNGTIHIVIESSASVRLDIDSDGDSTVDDYQYTTWAALRG